MGTGPALSEFPVPLFTTPRLSEHVGGFFDTLAEGKEAAKASKPDPRLYSLYAWVRFAQ